MGHETRHYTILGLIGRGGQGNVYRARLNSKGGFRKEVAIKILKEGLSEESLQRFRDEARILGLIRDRAIIAVDPPVRLAGRWSLVMELADGLSTQQILARAGPLPVTVAIEMVQEIARVLDKLYEARGQGGAPLRLLHRDIKPANIQITNDGEVKLLDFGVARADFDERETHTVQHIGGTFGFIAPERLKGVNSPACDIYSLGVTLRVLLTGEKPVTMGPATLAALSPALYEAIVFAEDMRNNDPERRPAAREVEARARAMRATMDGPTLREWAAQSVPRLQRTLDDPLVGSELTESFDLDERLSAESFSPPAAPLSQATVRRVAAVSGVLLLVVWVVAIVALVFITQEILERDAARAVQASAGELEPPPIEPPAPAPPKPPAPAQPAVPPPETKPPVPNIPAPAPPDLSLPKVRPQPVAPVFAAPSPPPQAKPTESVEIDAVRPCSVWIDDKWIGTTPLDALPLQAGTHQIRLVASDQIVEATVLVGGRRGATRFYWDGGTTLGTR